jgi:hypothetical protein
MKPFLIIVAVAIVLIVHPSATAQASCDVSFKVYVEVAGGEFSLADLLASDDCPSIQQAAGGVHLGTAPLAGSVRVLKGDDVRLLLTDLEQRAGNSPAWRVESIPERIVIRRKGSQISCAEIAARLIAMLGSHKLAEQSELGLKPGRKNVLEKSAPEKNAEPDCGAAGRISESARVEPVQAVWDASLGRWKIRARCSDPSDCVPFLVEAGRADSPSLVGPSAELTSIGITSTALSRQATGRLLVRPGQTVTLVWDQGGIRAIVPAISLDGGDSGDGVRARIARGGRIIPAIVVSAGIVRTAA